MTVRRIVLKLRVPIVAYRIPGCMMSVAVRTTEVCSIMSSAVASIVVCRAATAPPMGRALLLEVSRLTS